MYQQSYDESILLDHDCKRMLRRISRQLIIKEVEEKLSEIFMKTNSYENNKKIIEKII